MKQKQRNRVAAYREECRSQGEECISPCSSAEPEKDSNERARKSVSGRERATQAKCLKWITVGQTSEEGKTANMSHCSLLALNNRCLVSPSPLMVPDSGCSDLVSE